MVLHLGGSLLSFLSLLEKNVVRVTKQQLRGVRAQKPQRAYPQAIFGISCTDLFSKEAASGSG